MTGATHAIIGAALGRLAKRPSTALAAGVLSHLVADLIPHKDLPVKAEVPITAAVLGYMAYRYGVGSNQFWGAVGGVLPDLEHGLLIAGIIKPENEVFPTHMQDGRWHGRESNERLSQIAICAAGLLIADTNR